MRIQYGILKHNLAAILGSGDRVSIHLRRYGDCFRLRAGDDEILIVSLGRWYKYKRTVGTRLRTLAREYGCGIHYELSEDDVVIDIGANIGEFALFAAQQGACVYAVEADRAVFEVLKRNAQGHRITPLHCALWKENAQIPFYLSIEDADSSFIVPDRYTSRELRDAITLDALAKREGITRVTLIKCDAEGAEPEVLMGASEVLAKTRFIALDCGYERAGASTVTESRSILIKHGFKPTEYEAGGRLMLFAENPHLSPELDRRGLDVA